MGGAGAGGVNLFATISTFTSSTQVTLSASCAIAGITANGLTIGTDAGSALQAALNAIATAGGGAVVVDGSYFIASAVTKDFSNLAAGVRIIGWGSSSRLYIGVSHLTTAITVQNLQEFFIEGVYFVGTPKAVNDAFIALRMDGVWIARLRDCHFYGLSSVTTSGGAVVSFNNGALSLDHCRFGGCTGSTSTDASPVRASAWTKFSCKGCEFIDYGQLGGVLHSKTPLATATAWILIKAPNTSPPTNARSMNEVTVENTTFDEGAVFALNVDPGGSTRISSVRVTGCDVNINSFASAGGLGIVNVDNLTVLDCWFGYVASGTHYGVVAISCTNVLIRACKVAQNCVGHKVDTVTSWTLWDSPYTSNSITSSPNPKVILNGAIGQVESLTAAAVATSGTIAVAGVETARVSPTGAVTGVILAAGTVPGQELTVVNEAVAANTVTFAASGTSRVADGTGSVIAGLTARKFKWSSAAALWFPIK